MPDYCYYIGDWVAAGFAADKDLIDAFAVDYYYYDGMKAEDVAIVDSGNVIGIVDADMVVVVGDVEEPVAVEV